MIWSSSYRIQATASRARSLSHAPALSFLLAAVLALMEWGAFATLAQAQEDDAPEAQRYENVDWQWIILVDFEPGKTARAMEIIGDHFVPASEQAGTQVPRIVEMQTGPWDLMFIWTMEEGPSAMTWETSPEDIEWQKALAEIAGSEEEAENLLDEYQTLIARETSYVGMSGRHGRAIAGQ